MRRVQELAGEVDATYVLDYVVPHGIILIGLKVYLIA